jgi:hypothetical protein
MSVSVLLDEIGWSMAEVFHTHPRIYHNINWLSIKTLNGTPAVSRGLNTSRKFTDIIVDRPKEKRYNCLK